VIRFENVSVTYVGAERPALAQVDLEIPEGELALVVGRTGSGKSTLLRCINGLVPHFSGGTLAGRVSVEGRDTRTHPPRELADVVGFVGQDPAAGFVADVVEDELAYAMENLGLAPAVMRRRVEDVLDLLGLAELRDRPLLTLSGGQQQRVAIAAVLTASPRVLVLDEPTSALDPVAAEDVLASLTRLRDDLGLTVVLAEHRLERVVHHADRVVLVPGDAAPLQVAAPAEAMRTSAVAPPLVELGRLAGWSPLPLSVRDARRRAPELRGRLAPLVPAETEATAGREVASARGLTFRYGPLPVLRGVDLTLATGEVVALMGRNGSGKSTLLGLLAGLLKPAGGRIEVGGRPPFGRPGRDVVRAVGLVPQDPTLLLYGETVADEVALADREGRLEPGTTAAAVEHLAPGLDPGRHPRDLSEGQRLALALGVVLAAGPPLLLLDEPTRGLDYSAKRRLVTMLRGLAAGGRAVVLATHDVELVAEVATRTVVLAEGEVVADGPTRDVVRHSPGFAPQVAKVLAPQEWLTVSEVAAALEEVPA
jgi:energy-coupling factor transport system ATP-binding protein